MADEEAKSEGWEVLDACWFEAMDSLGATVMFNDDVRARTDAADTLLRYFVSLGQSINLPHIPSKRPEFNPIDPDDDGDEDE